MRRFCVLEAEEKKKSKRKEGVTGQLNRRTLVSKSGAVALSKGRRKECPLGCVIKNKSDPEKNM